LKKKGNSNSQRGDAMNRNVYQALSLGVLSVLLAACSTGSVAYPPATNPFLPGAPPIENVRLGPPTRVVLVWLEPTVTSMPPLAQRALAEKIRNTFPAGKRLEIVGAVTVPPPASDSLAQIRNAAAPFGVTEALVVMPNLAAASSPVWLKYGQDGSGAGTRTDSYASVSLVAVDLRTGAKLFSVVTNGEARLWKMDYEDARPFFPRISPGAYSNAYIYPSGSDFPPGEVHAVALEQAVNGLIYRLDRATSG
jgi:hypothetical protein